MVYWRIVQVVNIFNTFNEEVYLAPLLFDEGCLSVIRGLNECITLPLKNLQWEINESWTTHMNHSKSAARGRMCSQNLLITSAKYLYTLLGLLAFQRRYFFRERFYHRLILALQNIYRYEVYLFSDWCPHGRNSIWFGQGKRTAGRRPYSILCCVYNWGGFSNW